MTADWFLAASFCAAIAGLWAVNRQCQGSWIGPGGIACAVWLHATLLPLVFGGGNRLYPEAFLLVLAFVAAGTLGSCLPMALAGPRRPTEALGERRMQMLAWACVLCSLLGLFAPALLYQQAASKFSAESLILMASDVSHARYTGNFDQPLVVSLLNILTYGAALLGGLGGGYGAGSRLRALAFIAWVVPLAGISLITTSRANFVYGAVFYMAGRAAGAVLRGRDRRVSFLSLNGRIAGLWSVGYVFVLAVQLLRWGSTDLRRLDEAALVARIAMSGHMTVLGDWVDGGGIGRPALSGGAYTFAGVFELMGLTRRESGLYTDMVELEGGHTTNIYTAFRPLIDDFTLPGGLFVFGLLALAGGAGWALARRGHLLGAAPLALFLTFALWSPVTSILVYNTLIGALVLFAVVVSALAFVPVPAARKDEDAVEPPTSAAPALPPPGGVPA